MSFILSLFLYFVHSFVSVRKMRSSTEEFTCFNDIFTCERHKPSIVTSRIFHLRHETIVNVGLYVATWCVVPNLFRTHYLLQRQGQLQFIRNMWIAGHIPRKKTSDQHLRPTQIKETVFFHLNWIHSRCIYCELLSQIPHTQFPLLPTRKCVSA
jgi:hypothetical protein